ncbi:Hypothetical predicted protein [Marmota monax]|uniref:Uncharacterized protein n=1 Tax=Marmota monax TaxID=9995 RepID=A0A5E4AFB4_MARMO|nr:hypothetical protein GHT09_020156 [Marmota monax]VTJ55391.1 Hypothetical predicted protein [Marmota monax]
MPPSAPLCDSRNQAARERKPGAPCSLHPPGSGGPSFGSFHPVGLAPIHYSKDRRRHKGLLSENLVRKPGGQREILKLLALAGSPGKMLHESREGWSICGSSLGKATLRACSPRSHQKPFHPVQEKRGCGI